MKSFKSTAWLLPQPVLIIGTYDKDGKPNAMNAAWGGQWDMHEIIISLGSHQTTDNLVENPEFTVAFWQEYAWQDGEDRLEYREGSECQCSCIQRVPNDT